MNLYIPNSSNMANYNKGSAWKWVLIYLVLGAAVYGVIYYFVTNQGGY
jgi:hypothetical protein